MAKQEDQPKVLTTAQMEEIIERLKREGRLPSPEKLAAVMKGIKEEHRPRILAAQEESETLE